MGTAPVSTPVGLPDALPLSGGSAPPLVRVLEMPGAFAAERELVVERPQLAERIVRAERLPAIRAPNGDPEGGRRHAHSLEALDRIEGMEHGGAFPVGRPGPPSDLRWGPGPIDDGSISSGIGGGVNPASRGRGTPKSGGSGVSRLQISAQPIRIAPSTLQVAARLGFQRDSTLVSAESDRFSR